MFAKKPTTSFQNLTELQRTTSAGLLTQLMNPDPAIFPVNHPYRRGHSSGEIQRMGMTPMTSLTSMTSAIQTQAQRTKSQPLDQPPAPQQQQPRRPPPADQQVPEPKPAPKPANAQQQAQPPAQQKKNPPRTRPLPRRSVTLDSHTMPPPPPPVTTTTAAADNVNNSTAVPPSPVRSERRAPSVIGMALRGMRTLAFGTGKSTTAGPMESQVIAGSVSTKHVAKAPAAPPTSPEVRSPGSSTGYRPKGPLPGQEMDTDSEDEAEENHLQLSKSVAQDRLKQFAARRGIVAAGSTLSSARE
ncbi:hypothetical protein FA13DRAFT_156369 [Coprinellus micaceus]|uniref:Uncharacterized protein n=1 Tax=Coprinellus micaceus TaxID=71717 RepID=A0A4Y7THS5_COPMI|nr:hypothetical protein FA13DRAFT_156369 [Coprinellus micaceus]